MRTQPAQRPPALATPAGESPVSRTVTRGPLPGPELGRHVLGDVRGGAAGLLIAAKYFRWKPTGE